MEDSQKKDITFNVYFGVHDKELLDKIRDKAKAQGLNVSAFMKRAARNELERENLESWIKTAVSEALADVEITTANSGEVEDAVTKYMDGLTKSIGGS